MRNRPNTFILPLTAALISAALMLAGCTGTVHVRPYADVPILMYHSVTENENEKTEYTITIKGLEEQLSALSGAGYKAIDFSELYSYVTLGTPLPEKPVIITFDDGYESNLTLVPALLEKHAMKATVSVIGVSAGKTTYKDTGIPIIPHFSYDEAKKAYESGLFDFQSHSYDMHNNSLDTDFRDGMLKKATETDGEYALALENDWKRSKSELETGIGNNVFVILYPFGKYTETTDRILKEAGAKISVTSDAGVSRVSYGDADTLRLLKRFNIDDSLTGAQLIELIESGS